MPTHGLKRPVYGTAGSRPVLWYLAVEHVRNRFACVPGAMRRGGSARATGSSDAAYLPPQLRLLRLRQLKSPAPSATSAHCGTARTARRSSPAHSRSSADQPYNGAEQGPGRSGSATQTARSGMGGAAASRRSGKGSHGGSGLRSSHRPQHAGGREPALFPRSSRAWARDADRSGALR